MTMSRAEAVHCLWSLALDVSDGRGLSVAARAVTALGVLGVTPAEIHATLVTESQQ